MEEVLSLNAVLEIRKERMDTAAQSLPGSLTTSSHYSLCLLKSFPEFPGAKG